MKIRYEILVNGKPLNPGQRETAESPEAAVNVFLTRVYGSALSSRAPYNISARRFVTAYDHADGSLRRINFAHRVTV